MSEPTPLGSSLLTLAVEGIAPQVGGCARLFRPGVVDKASSEAPPAAGQFPKAINHFGPAIVARWRAYLDARTGADQEDAVKALADLSVSAARDEAVSALARLVPDARADDRGVVLDYLVALPRSAKRALIPEVGTSLWRLPPLLLPLSERTLFGLLPFHVPPAAPGADLPGTPYRLEEMLGSSRTGVLYQAMNLGESAPQPVALKVCLDPVRANLLRKRRDQLERIRTLASKTWSPRLARLLASTVEGEQPFLVYEMAPGNDLTTYLAINRPTTDLGLRPSRAFDVIRQLASGLAVLHGRGLVHGDLKPTNVRVHEDRVRLTDVGFGDVVRISFAPTGAGTAATAGGIEAFDPAAQASLFNGSYSELYRPPEQSLGGRPDPRHDLYSLGVLWYQILLGDFALQLDATAVGGLVEGPFELPRGQVGLIQQCVGEFAQRPANAQELLNLMRPSVAVILNLAHGGVQPRAPQPPSSGSSPGLRRLEQRMARSRGPSDGSAEAGRPDPLKAQAEIERLKSAMADQIERDALHEARATAEVLLRLAPEDEDILDTVAFLNEQLNALPVDPLEEVRAFTGHSDWVNSAVFAPDGKRILSGAGGTPTGGEYGEAKDRTMRLWDVETGAEVRQYEGHSTIVTSVAFVPDGRRFLSASRGGTIALWDLESGRTLRRFDRRLKIVWCVAISPDGRSALSGSDDKSVRLWNVDAGTRVRRLEGHSKGCNSVVFSPDGRRALSASFDNTIRLWDMQSGQNLSCLEGHVQAALAVAFTPDGRHALSGGLDTFIRVWDLGTRRQLRQLMGHTAQINCLAVSRDGRWALSGGTDNTVRLWDLQLGKEQARFAGHTNSITSVAFSPDSRLAVSASRDTTMRLLKVPK